jgi:hypothetical protein
MSRRSVEPPKETLGQMIVIYFGNKEDEARIKKITDDYNKRIKAEMSSQGLTEFEEGDLKASISSTPREDFNEQQAIEILRSQLTPLVFSEIVKTREYLDQDALEKAVYNKQLDAAILAPCVTPKEPTVTLRVTEKKKK